MRILLVDDDQNLIDLLQRILAEQNYAIDAVHDGEQGWIYGCTYTYDLMILDWSLPKLDGISLCKRFRANGYDIPIILLTSRHGSQNTIKALDAGADDYICKPFDIEELMARIRTLLRRINCDFFPLLSWGDLKLDPCSCQVSYKDEILNLSAKEYRLLELFLRHNQEVLTIEEIMESLWSSTEYPAEATVRSHLRRLRQKLKLAGIEEDPIETVRGQGYCLKSLGTNHQKDHTIINSPEKRSRHLAALNSVWEKYQEKSIQQILTVEKAIKALQTETLSLSDRLSAITSAHSLAGNLGLFGFNQGSQIAKELEQVLQNNPSQETEQWLEWLTKLQNLRQELTVNSSIYRQISQKLAENAPLLLIVTDESHLISQLSQAASEAGMRTKNFPTPELAQIWLEETQAESEELPHIVILKILFTEEQSESGSRQEYLALIAEFNLLVPSIPVIVIGDRDRFQDRLKVARHGGSFYLTEPINPSDTIAFCQQILQRSSKGKKIMVVDDDVEFLQILPSLLSPWEFKLTTLDDSRQFWDVLQAVAPDLLVLDIEMPYLSGIEICKVLRTHPYWCKLPVLFLSVHNDVAISTQVFASGGDDFINKPFHPQHLAHRILNRLEQ